MNPGNPSVTVAQGRRKNFRLKVEKGTYFGYVANKNGLSIFQLVPVNSAQSSKIAVEQLEEEAA